MKIKKSFLFIFSILLSVICILSATNIFYVSADNKVYLGGFTAGFSVECRGATVVGLTDVITKNGIESPSKNADIRVGDIILKIDNNLVNNASDVAKQIKDKKRVKVLIKRDGLEVEVLVSVALDLSNTEKLGLFIKDDINGIGTITFIKNNKFASLGHPIVNEDGNNLEILSGNLFNCSISGVVKGEKGKVGELRGIFLKNNPIARVEKNLDCGVFGTINENFDVSNLREIEIGKAEIGDAKIYTTIDNCCAKDYSISIVKIDNDNHNKNFVIKVTDKNLLNITNGIVQGMSGSPIIQNNKLVGCVTHVFINDPTRGFGLSVDKMLNNM